MWLACPVDVPINSISKVWTVAAMSASIDVSTKVISERRDLFLNILNCVAKLVFHKGASLFNLLFFLSKGV